MKYTLHVFLILLTSCAALIPVAEEVVEELVVEVVEEGAKELEEYEVNKCRDGQGAEQAVK